MRPPPRLVDTTAIPGLAEVRQNESGLAVGAAVTHTNVARCEVVHLSFANSMENIRRALERIRHVAKRAQEQAGGSGL